MLGPAARLNTWRVEMGVWQPPWPRHEFAAGIHSSEGSNSLPTGPPPHDSPVLDTRYPQPPWSRQALLPPQVWSSTVAHAPLPFSVAIPPQPLPAHSLRP